MNPRKVAPKEKLMVNGRLASGPVKGLVEVVSQPYPEKAPLIKLLNKFGEFKKGHQFLASWDELSDV